MMNQNQAILFQASHFRCLFDTAVEAFLLRRNRQLETDLIHRNCIFIFKSSEMNPSEFEKCHFNRGEWKFAAHSWDYTCGVYDAIEVIRQAILSAMYSDKTSVEIALVYPKDNPNYYYLINCDQHHENYIDLERLKKRKVFSYRLSNDNRCECETGISHRIFFQILEPALSNLMELMNYKMNLIVLEDKTVNERSGPFSSMYFQRNLKAIRIKWGLPSSSQPLAKLVEELPTNQEALLIA